MTATTIPARPAPGAGLRPVPWRQVIWVAWRQHRIALGGVAVLLGAIALYLWFTGLQMHHAYATSCHPASTLACNIDFTGKYSTSVNVVRAALQVVPALIGAFVGAPVLAREMETGTFRYAWTQGFGRWRWTLGKLVVLAVAVTATAAAFSLLFSWYLHPFSAAGYSIPFATDVFDLREVAFTGWTLAAFAIGALAGMLIRRTVPAIATTLAVYAGLACTTALWLRQHYMTPLLTTKLNLPASAWTVNQWYTKGGTFAFGGHGSRLVNAVQSLCPPLGPGGSGGGPGQCLTQHGYTLWSSYQPGSRFWPFQWIEGGWLLALSVLLIAAAVWLVRRRAT
ncbi:MAG TPA: ABC transporter permease subunit [Streptosporangiaceae bacterium]|jgi:ABC-type transport system involved in multi-copper enzyme maturation permease subunit